PPGPVKLSTSSARAKLDVFMASLKVKVSELIGGFKVPLGLLDSTDAPAGPTLAPTEKPASQVAQAPLEPVYSLPDQKGLRGFPEEAVSALRALYARARCGEDSRRESV